MKRKLNIFRLYGTPVFVTAMLAITALAALFVGCTEEADPGGSGGTQKYRMVTVTLPPLVRESDGQASGIWKSSERESTVLQTEKHSPFTVTRSCVKGNAAVQATTCTDAQAVTRAQHPEYTNVWLLQFGSDETLMQSTYVGAAEADGNITVTVAVAENCTFYVVTNGPEQSSTKQDLTAGSTEASDFAPATIAALKAMNLSRADEIQPSYLASLSNVSVEMYNGENRIVSTNGEPLTFLLRPVTPTLTASVNLFIPGWEVVGMELYNVPKNSKYIAGESNVPPYPVAEADNFDYTNREEAGKPLPCTISDNGGTIGTWYPYENLQQPAGDKTISKESDRNHANSPAYATFLRVRIKNTATPESTATFDIYPGKGLQDYELQRNHTYMFFIVIDGTEDDLKNKYGGDDRVTIAGPIAETI